MVTKLTKTHLLVCSLICVPPADVVAPVEREIRSLANGLTAVKDEQEYIIVREKIHRNTAESTNTRVKWWAILQAAVLFGVVGWQVMYLKVRIKYFEKNLAKNFLPVIS